MSNSLSKIPTTLFAFATMAAAVVSWPVRVAAARRVLSQLVGMSDGELRDIGLNRSDLKDATALPRASDPGQMFRTRAEARRSARLDCGRLSQAALSGYRTPSSSRPKARQTRPAYL